ncbi:MAG TPA: hypothetical protein VJ180_06280 [Pyrinomonadaceae bacterium]|nr:hypothetical protein [Pyrinomonadaceae bacterium]
MKEDILEQLVDDYLQSRGYFTQHNIKFRPRENHPDFVTKQDSNHSDIDIIGVAPRKRGTDRVVAVSCKSWQAGFDVKAKLDEIKHNKIRSGRESWKAFREIVQPKWSEAFISAVREATGTTKFTYITAVTRIKGDRSLWEKNRGFSSALKGNPIRILTLSDMSTDLLSELSTTLVGSQLGRTLQLLKASGATIKWQSSKK